MLSRVGCCLIRIPLPERFAIHKLIVSQLRTGKGAKVLKDIHQACVVASCLAEEHPGALADAVEAVPAAAVKRLKRGLEAARKTLETQAPRAWEELSSALL